MLLIVPLNSCSGKRSSLCDLESVEAGKYSSANTNDSSAKFSVAAPIQYAPHKKGHSNMITKSRAEELAIAEFERNGRRHEDYNVVVLAVDDGKNWIVSFDKKGERKPGGKHLVTVEKDGGKTVFMEGE